jgi:hypothetical protein
MASIEKIADLAGAQEEIADLVADWQYAVDNHPGEFNDLFARMNYMRLALNEVFGDASLADDFMNKPLLELQGKTPRESVSQGREGFKLALGCLAM